MKSKFAFIDGENFQEIGGLSSFGTQLARVVDTQFFKEALQISKAVQVENISQSIRDFIDKVQDRSKIVIFAGIHSQRKLEDVKYSNSGILPYSYNTFYNIPIINSFNKNHIFVIDFNKVKVNIYTSNSKKWYNGQLLVDITEYQKEIITNDIITKWNENDGYDYNIEEIDILESNNVNMKILFKGDYVLKILKIFWLLIVV
ncbi:hypothetical protein [Chryseobacterium sp. 3008163]|uniref:hypothetical protein n=1 Tax=Chryseobacterium sp. 3008163 TaxID=2478663 RepID=UPI000F0D0C38|nr:hypothetical protein [Chryseobacterium sp. 3008163]AYN00244.1 hypothetical protein EAG08_07820 [Chryseobacterium sp. 3008163]